MYAVLYMYMESDLKPKESGTANSTATYAPPLRDACSRVSMESLCVGEKWNCIV